MLEPIYNARRALLRWRKRSKPGGVILMYHRVAPLSVDPWDLNVTPEYFDQHMAALNKHTQPISLVELGNALASGKVPERFSVVTFDDGYYNNLQHAKPILEKHNVPATVFVSTGYTDSQREFWWDELESVVLLPDALPARLQLELLGKRYTWDLTKAAEPYEWDTAKRPNDPARDARMGFYHSLWQPMQKMPEQERWQAIDQIRSWSGWAGGQRESHRPMTKAELSELVGTGVVDVGGHTISHPFLPGLGIDMQREEIQRGKDQLEAFVGRAVQTFSYPFNCHTRQTEKIAREVGFTIACTGREESVWHKSDPFQATRFSAEQYDGDEFQRRLLQWLG